MACAEINNWRNNSILHGFKPYLLWSTALTALAGATGDILDPGCDQNSSRTQPCCCRAHPAEQAVHCTWQHQCHSQQIHKRQFSMSNDYNLAEKRLLSSRRSGRRRCRFVVPLTTNQARAAAQSCSPALIYAAN